MWVCPWEARSYRGAFGKRRMHSWKDADRVNVLQLVGVNVSRHLPFGTRGPESPCSETSFH